MSQKTSIIAWNWIVFLALLLIGFSLIPYLISASYHPNKPQSPYVLGSFYILLFAIPIFFLWTLTISIIRKRVSEREIYRASLSAYAVLAFFCVVMLAMVKPVPRHFIQYVNDLEYRVPSEFMRSENQANRLNFWICIEDLRGNYSSPKPTCHVDEVTLSAQAMEATLPITGFFEDMDEFDLNRGIVVFNEGSNQYQIPDQGDLKLYTVDKLWAKHDLIYPSNDYPRTTPVHFQVNEQDQLVRFITCHQPAESRSKCYHIASTSRGTLEYQVVDLMDFNVERWESKETEILNLISQWAVE